MRSRWKRRGRYLIAAALLHVVWAGGWYLGESVDDSDDAEPQVRITEALIVARLSPVASEPAATPASTPPKPEPELRRDASADSASSPPSAHGSEPPGLAPAADAENTPASVFGPVLRAADTSVAAIAPTSPMENPTSAETSATAPAPDSVSFEGSANPATTWESQVLAHLDRNKRYPSLALRRGQEDRVSVRIRVDRTGQVLSQRIVDSHGYELLDQEVLALIGRASPLPAPPAEIPDRDLEFLVPVEFFIDRQTVRLW
ncbi:MAG: TonB family protein [Panacagrimonas sp.]